MVSLWRRCRSSHASSVNFPWTREHKGYVLVPYCLSSANGRSCEVPRELVGGEIMTSTTTSFAALLEQFFTQRLIKQRKASPHTIASYRDAFCMLLRFTQEHLKKPPSRLDLSDVDAALIVAFLESLEKDRKISSRTRNARLMAIRAFFRYLALEVPTHSGQIQRVLAIPSQRQTRSLVTYLTQQEVEALLSAPDRSTWSGRRDYVFLLVAVQTGLRLAEMTKLQLKDLNLETGAHIRVTGKGRKERIV